MEIWHGGQAGERRYTSYAFAIPVDDSYVKILLDINGFNDTPSTGLSVPNKNASTRFQFALCFCVS